MSILKHVNVRKVEPTKDQNLALKREFSEKTMQSTSQYFQTAVPYAKNENMTASALPEDLVLELKRMRRNPSEFTRLQTSRCKLCYGNTAIDLRHPLNPQHAGTWCSVHGWLSFDSPRIRPIEEEFASIRVVRKKVVTKRRVDKNSALTMPI